MKDKKLAIYQLSSFSYNLFRKNSFLIRPTEKFLLIKKLLLASENSPADDG